MKIEEIQERKSDLIRGLEGLYTKFEQIKVAIEIQKGAISECDYWISDVDKDNKDSEPEKEIKEEKVKLNKI